MYQYVFAFPYKAARLCRQLLFGFILINFFGCALFTEKQSPAEMMLPREQIEQGIITPEKPRFEDEANLPVGSISKTPLQPNFTNESNIKKPFALSVDDWLALKDGLLITMQHESLKDSFEWNNPLTKANGKITRLDNFGKCQRLIFSVVKTNKDYWFETTLCKTTTKLYDIHTMKAWL